MESEYVDYITGKKLPNTSVEKVRQKLERFLIEEKGYSKEEIELDVGREFVVNGEKVEARAEIFVRVERRNFMAVKCEPPTRLIGALERRTVSIARLLDDMPVPIVVLTNGSEAVVIDVLLGKTIGENLNAIPSKSEAVELIKKKKIEKLPKNKIEKEKRIILAFAAIVCEECKPSYACKQL
jgi:hypothetical protein